MSATTGCPECRSDIPVPRFRRGRGEVLIRCRMCRKLLAIGRMPEINAEHDSEDQVGKAFGLPGYELLGVLGRGGMGLVFSAVREQDHELVAVKVLPPECWRYPELLQRFHMEAQMMATLDHPNIVPVLDRGRWNDYPYIVMDYVPGCTLKHRIERAAPLGIDEVLAIATPVSEAIQACHDHGLVHRDLKPGNVLLSQSGRVLVTDFGISNLLMRLGEQTDHGVMIGTPQYIAPEQMQNGSAVGIRADQYSLGVMIYEMLTRTLPLGIFEPPSVRSREINPEAESVLLKALAHDERNRFENVRQFVRSFRKALDRQSRQASVEELVKIAASTKGDCETPFPKQGPSVRVAVIGPNGRVVMERDAPTTIVESSEPEDFFGEQTPFSATPIGSGGPSVEQIIETAPLGDAPRPAPNPIPVQPKDSSEAIAREAPSASSHRWFFAAVMGAFIALVALLVMLLG